MTTTGLSNGVLKPSTGNGTDRDKLEDDFRDICLTEIPAALSAYSAMQDRTGADLVRSYQNSIPCYQVHGGVPFPGAILTHRMADITTFNVREDDVIIAGYPRSGNHWMKEVVTLLCADDIPQKPETPSEKNDKHIYERIPLLEFSVDLKQCMQTYMDNYFTKFGPMRPVLSKIATKFGLISSEKLFSQAYLDPLSDLDSRRSPRFYHTHLTYSMLPEQAQNGKCKMIYLIRNGKDVAVSFYEMHKMYPPFGYYSGDWREFFFTYLTGKVCFGSWFDHVAEWWQHRHQTRILFVKYEDMIEDLHREVRRVADFLGKSLDASKMEQIAGKCTFKSMRENPNATYDGMHNSIDTRKTSFLRKGKVADWKCRLTVEESEMFDNLYHEAFKDGGPEIRFELP